MDILIVRDLIRSFLAEDIGAGDITSEAIFQADQNGMAEFVAREPFIAAGIELIAAETFRLQNPEIHVAGIADGTQVNEGDVILTASGPVLDLLKAERVALNLAQRLCGIATMTHQYVDKVRNFPVRIVDTRKTSPGLRVFEKYAVRVGGGYNHRYNLADGVLIKDNHIAAAGSVREAVERVRKQAPHTMRIEVEAESIDQVEECLASGVDIIMLDNMDIEMMREAVKMIDNGAIVEASGGITLDNVKEVAGTGVDIISIGALTHSVTACDIGMRIPLANL